MTTRPYRSFRELALEARPGRDYQILARWGRSGLLVMAPHGGGIEKGTDTLASILAGRRHAFYGFIGLKPRDNRSLHLTSHRFDEPTALRMIRRARWILTIHGCAPSDATIRVGGRDRRGCWIFQRSLQQAGFRARLSKRPELAGRHPANLCNRGRSRRGVQLEIARDLRDPHQGCAGHPIPHRRLIRALMTALEAIPATAARGGEPISFLRRPTWQLNV